MLAQLPFELLAHVVAYLPTANALRTFSLTCRTLKRFVDQEGWRIFTHQRFPSIPVPPLWKDAAHALTTLSKNWDRKAFIARYLEPNGVVTALPTGYQIQKWRRPRGQSMGYQPVIDSYLEWTGPRWGDRKNLLIWSAGTELIVRIRQTTEAAALQWRRAGSDPDRLFCQNRWFSYKPLESSEGRDDITGLKLLRPSQLGTGSTSSEVQHAMIGRASGDLRRVELNLSSPGELRHQDFATRGQLVQALDISPSNNPLVAVCLGDTRVALYEAYNDKRLNEPISDVTAPKGPPHHLWSVKFLKENKFAVGSGLCKDPLTIYSINPDGIASDPLWKLGELSLASDPERVWSHPTSIYSFATLPHSSNGSARSEEVFLSGAYDGKIRVHDLRSPQSVEQVYRDPTDDSAIYSLATLGRERLAAGTARHSMVKFFDLRMSGARAYHYVDLQSPEAPYGLGSTVEDNDAQPSKNKPTKQAQRHPRETTAIGANWNLFLNPREMHSAPGRGHSTWSSRRSTESPVYSLSMPSSYSPTLYAGVENAVVQLDFTSILDRHPDPLYADSLKFDAGGGVDVRQTWNPRSDALNLAMYEQLREDKGETMRLKLQQSLTARYWPHRPWGLEERWKDSSEV
ncbi:MAG: hypothetical protein M1820_001271 [Bogoriella megaspora]|nr:MAG: hypothetical protein M1820_001271 [Bogoriella megaspora]